MFVRPIRWVSSLPAAVLDGNNGMAHHEFYDVTSIPQRLPPHARSNREQNSDETSMNISDEAVNLPAQSQLPLPAAPTTTTTTASSTARPPLLTSSTHSPFVRQAPPWQPDDSTDHCTNPNCRRPFSLWTRKHHCRWCGLIFCDPCSRQRVPRIPGMAQDPSPTLTLPLQQGDERRRRRWSMGEGSRGVRVCDGCAREIRGIGSGEPVSAHPRIPLSPSSTFSSEQGEQEDSPVIQASANQDIPNIEEALATCPVCGTHLSALEDQQAVEQHLHDCLTHGSVDPHDGITRRPVQIAGDAYVVSKLRNAQELAGCECLICLEGFDKGQRVARLNCLCVFHQECVDAWFVRGKKCPVHSVHALDLEEEFS